MAPTLSVAPIVRVWIPSGAGQLDALGNQTLTIGATLNVGANQAPGDYSGSFSVTVAYN